MRDIATRVGKSVAAVSKALNGSPDIGPETLATVQKVATELGYEPNVAAQQLKLQRADTVGLVLPPTGDLRLSDPFFSDFLTGLVEQLEAFGLSLLVSAVADGDSESIHLKQARGRRVDGFVLVRTRLDDTRIKLLADRAIPFVAFGRPSDGVDCSYVDEDGRSAMNG